MRSRLALLMLLVALLAPSAAGAQSSVREDGHRVAVLNAFADALLAVVARWQASDRVIKTARPGGYAGRPNAFQEVDYVDTTSKRLLARVRWLTADPKVAQMVEVNLHDTRGALIADYFVSYLLDHRNAPMHALINLHNRADGLRAFRQFDPFGEVLFERCQGSHGGKAVDISLDAYDWTVSKLDVPAAIYAACFGSLPDAPGGFARPAEKFAAGDTTDAEALLAEMDVKIATRPGDAGLYVKRGKMLFLMGRMREAAADFARALELDPTRDAAWYGRGMALGRLGRLEEGIADLTEFLRRNPASSLGYTKRGVRKIWNRDFHGAVADLTKAVDLDPSNAEAHDDLGVARAQLGDHAAARVHFRQAIAIEPSYAKAYHNLATVLTLDGAHTEALAAVEAALALQPDNKGTLLLKGAILEGLGRTEAAAAVRARARLLPDGDWSERSALR